MASKATGWIAGTVAASLVIAAGAWFGAVQPTLSRAQEQRDAASDQRQRNVVLEAQIAKLKAESAHLGDYQQQLEALRQKVPATADLAEATRELQGIAQAAGVTITVVQPGTPSIFVPAAPVAPTPSPTPSSTKDAGAAADTTAASSPQSTKSGAIDGLFTIPLAVTTLGTYAQTVQFIDAVQQSMPRLFVVSKIDATAQKSAAATAGRPALADGDLEATLTGVLLTLRDDTTQKPSPGATTSPTPTQMPQPSDQKNPFQPVGG